MEAVGAHLLVFGLLWATLIGGGGTLLVRNQWGLVAGSPGAVFLGVCPTILEETPVSGPG